MLHYTQHLAFLFRLFRLLDYHYIRVSFELFWLFCEFNMVIWVFILNQQHQRIPHPFPHLTLPPPTDGLTMPPNVAALQQKQHSAFMPPPSQKKYAHMHNVSKFIPNHFEQCPFFAIKPTSRRQRHWKQYKRRCRPVTMSSVVITVLQ